MKNIPWHCALGLDYKPLVRSRSVTTVSTSGLIDAVAERCQATVVRSAVGEANVVDSMQTHHAVIGGEGNGGVIDPRVVLDAIVISVSR